MGKKCEKSPPCPKHSNQQICCPPMICRPPYPREICVSKLDCHIRPKRYPCPPQRCMITRSPPPNPCPTITDCQRPLCAPAACPPENCCPEPTRRKKCSKKAVCQQPNSPQPCSTCCEKKPCRNPSDYSTPSCSNPQDYTCMPACPPREICCPEQKSYNNKNCCTGAFMSKYLLGTTVDAAILDALDGMQDIMGYLEENGNDPDFYKSSCFRDLECPDEIMRKKMIDDIRRRVECEPVWVVPGKRYEPPC